VYSEHNVRYALATSFKYSVVGKLSVLLEDNKMIVREDMDIQLKIIECYEDIMGFKETRRSHVTRSLGSSSSVGKESSLKNQIL